MGKIVLFVPFEAVGKLLGGIAKGVSNGFEVVADAITPDDDQPPILYPKQSSPRTYVVQDGDTLLDIASSELGKGYRWREIASLNDIEDSRLIQPGQRLRLPEH